MAFALYFAVSPGEIRLLNPTPMPMAWLSCHFSPCGVGLSNVPSKLPDNSILIIDDSSPVADHDPALIARQVSALNIHSVLLDFQRPPTAEAQAMAKDLVSRLSCPVGVAENYAKGLDCPVFLPPPPLYCTLVEYIAPWKEREIWLEAALGQECVSITSDGFRSSEDCPKSENPVHYSDVLACHYQIIPSDREISFLLHRTREDLSELLKIAESLGISLAIGLYQELQ